MTQNSDTKVYSATEAREKFADLFDAAHYGERVVIRKRNRQVAVVPIEVLERLDALSGDAPVRSKAEVDQPKSRFQQLGVKTLREIKAETKSFE